MKCVDCPKDLFPKLWCFYALGPTAQEITALTPESTALPTRSSTQGRRSGAVHTADVRPSVRDIDAGKILFQLNCDTTVSTSTYKLEV